MFEYLTKDMVICASFSQLDLSRIEVWITCIYSRCFFFSSWSYIVNMAFLSLKFLSIVHYPVDLSVTFLSAVSISFSGHVVIRVWLIMFVQVTIWYIPRHDHLQSVNQLRETGTRGWIFIPALRHQFISIIDWRLQKVSCIAEQTRSIYNICQSQLEIHPRLNQFLDIV